MPTTPSLQRKSTMHRLNGGVKSIRTLAAGF
jgi:hypothetical protein